MSLMNVQVALAMVLEPDPVITGPATWTYRLRVRAMTGEEITIDYTPPADERPDPEIVDAVSYKPGRLLIGTLRDGRTWHFPFHEREAVEACEERAGGGNGG